MDNKFNVQAGDVIFRRARNGWIVYTIEGGEWVSDVGGPYMDPMTVVTEVFAEPEHGDEVDEGVESPKALLDALRAVFYDHFRSKWRGGIQATLRRKGWGHEDHDPDGDRFGEE